MDFQKVIAVATRRGIFQPAFEAYGGLAGFIDYGPVGVRMRRRILEVWRNPQFKLKNYKAVADNAWEKAEIQVALSKFGEFGS